MCNTCNDGICTNRCATTAPNDELIALRTFRDRVLCLLQTAKSDPLSATDLRTSLAGDVLRAQIPVTITRRGSIDAYLLPDTLVREMIELRQEDAHA